MIVSSDYPDNSLVEQLSNLSLDNVQDLLQKSLAEKWKIAQNLAGQLSIIHTAGFVHRFLDLNIVSKGPVDSYVFEIDEVVREEDVRAERGTYGANLKTIPPERRVYPFFGDWYKGDIYAMGTIFLQLGGLNLEGVDQSMVDFSAEHAQHMCTQDPLPQVQLLAKLGFWMMHSDPAKRPASMQEVCAFLYSREVTALPQLSAYPDTVVQDQKVDERICALVNSKLKRDKKLIKLAPMVAKIVSTATTGFFRLKKPDLKIFYFHEHTCVVFLPKMKRKGGAFKNSRVPKILYLVEGGSLLADWHALTPRKFAGKSNENYNDFYQREFALYNMLEGVELFPKHIVSYCFQEKPSKRIGFYEHVPFTFSAWLKKQRMNPEGVLSTVKSMLQTVLSLHKLGFAHRDIKQLNLLVRDNGQVLLCDSDSVSLDKVAEMHNENVGTPLYRPPERKSQEYRGSWFPTDAFGVGCVIYEILFGNYLPWDVDDAEEFERLKTVPQESAGCNDFQLVALKLIEPKVAERLTVEQALEQLQQTKIQKLAKSGCAVQ